MFLGRVVHVPADGLPYPVFAYSGMVLWQLFAQALTESSNSVVTNERLISKVYFPRLFVPLSAVLASLLDFAISLSCWLVSRLLSRRAISHACCFFRSLCCWRSCRRWALGYGFPRSMSSFRDVRYTINFLVQFWFLATPIAYPASVVPERWRFVYDLNPMVGAVDGFRWALRGDGSISRAVSDLSLSRFQLWSC